MSVKKRNKKTHFLLKKTNKQKQKNKKKKPQKYSFLQFQIKGDLFA